tara:strand:- start:465 stop:1361 length:897 start_codon:yes stop_codon:yes gene_type:complete
LKKVSKEDLRQSDDNKTGCLYIIATPIGNYDDISLRAIKLLVNVDILLCEDTRKTKKLLSHLNIKRKNLMSYNDNNAVNKRPQIISKLLSRKKVGIVSDAGTPLISDPGYKLVQECHLNNIKVTHAPGPSAVINGLILSGLPTNQFYFGGFVSSKKNLKKKQFEATQTFEMTGIWFDTCLRINNTIMIMQEVFGNRKVSIARELTKTYEEIITDDLNNIINIIRDREINNKPLKGEIILIVDGYKKKEFNVDKLNVIIKSKLEKLSLRDAVEEIIIETKLPRRLIYNEAIKIRNNVCT